MDGGRVLVEEAPSQLDANADEAASEDASLYLNFSW